MQLQMLLMDRATFYNVLPKEQAVAVNKAMPKKNKLKLIKNEIFQFPEFSVLQLYNSKDPLTK